ncbi:MAG: ribonuclease M5 [Erysipelotrichaceae bacterium]|nr:ribonuclease M5 [Erysipelotrichaceae bacterium]
MIKQIIVVEGKNDTKRLKSFFDVETIETHGMGLGQQTVELIKAANKKRGVILFLDPDAPGEKIRKRLNEAIPGLLNAFVMKEDARTKKKVGIEHASKEVLAEALDHLVSYEEDKESISKEEFYELGLEGNKDSSVKREKIAKVFHLGRCNAKTLFRRMNLMNITYQEAKEVL